MAELAADYVASYERIIDRFTAWASGEPGIRATMAAAADERAARAWFDAIVTDQEIPKHTH